MSVSGSDTTPPPDVAEAAAPTSPPPTEGSSADTERPNGVEVRFGCKCLNVLVTGRAEGGLGDETGQEGDEGGSSTGASGARERRVWLSDGSEQSKHPLYVTYDVPAPTALDGRARGVLSPERQARGRGLDDADLAEGERVGRVCWLCGTAVYAVSGGGRGRDDPPAKEEEVIVDLSSGVLFGAALEAAEASAGLPFSSLHLPLPSSSSTFGRPPRESLTTVYPPISSSPPASSGAAPTVRPTTASTSTTATATTDLLPRIPDPFFLPPPFIPSHPHLKVLCEQAVAFLHDQHRRAEHEVRDFIELRARAVRDLEEQVRNEVEMMWAKYIDGPGRGELDLERRRSSSIGPYAAASAGAGAGADRGRRGSAATIVPGGSGSGRDGTGAGTGAGTGTGGGASGARVGRRITRSPGGVVSPTGYSTANGSTRARSPLVQPSENPILREASLQAYPGTSLLSASLSNASHFPRPPPVPEPVADAVDDGIDETIRAVGKGGDERAVAMSYIFSSLDGAMEARAQGQAQAGGSKRGSRGRRRSSAKESRESRTDTHGKDSWIDEERSVLAAASAGIAAETEGREKGDKEEEEGDAEEGGSTPRMKPIKELPGGEDAKVGASGRRGSLLAAGAGKGREKGKVTFEDSAKEDGTARQAEANAERPETAEDEDYVFDFELEDNTATPASAGTDGPTAGGPQPAVPRPRNMVEQSLSDAFASDIPSHRSAARSKRSYPYGPLRRKESDSDMSSASEAEEEAGISKLATSMPVAITFPAKGARAAVTRPHPLERKTSLSDRQGMMVPSLLAAMKQRGVDIPGSSGGALGAGNSPGAGTHGGRSALRRGSRTASISREREREQVRTFKADPGAVFESLADEVGDDEDDDAGQEGAAGGASEVETGDGTVRESRGFVPPHVLARMESRESQDVGWRSMISD